VDERALPIKGEVEKNCRYEEIPADLSIHRQADAHRDEGKLPTTRKNQFEHRAEVRGNQTLRMSTKSIIA
jgi:hypothetical protein